MSKRNSGRKLEWTEAENQIILDHQARAKAAGNMHPWKGQAGAEGLLPDRDDLVDGDLYRRAKKLNERTRSRAKAAAAPQPAAPPPARAPKGMTSRHRGVRCPAAVRGLRPSSTREPFLDARRGARAGTSAGKWRATVTINGQTQELGTFDEEDDAGRAVQTAREGARREAAAALDRERAAVEQRRAAAQRDFAAKLKAERAADERRFEVLRARHVKLLARRGSVQHAEMLGGMPWRALLRPESARRGERNFWNLTLEYEACPSEHPLEPAPPGSPLAMLNLHRRPLRVGSSWSCDRCGDDCTGCCGPAPMRVRLGLVDDSPGTVLYEMMPPPPLDKWVCAGEANVIEDVVRDLVERATPGEDDETEEDDLGSYAPITYQGGYREQMTDEVVWAWSGDYWEPANEGEEEALIERLLAGDVTEKTKAMWRACGGTVPDIKDESVRDAKIEDARYRATGGTVYSAPIYGPHGLLAEAELYAEDPAAALESFCQEAARDRAATRERRREDFVALPDARAFLDARRGGPRRFFHEPTGGLGHAPALNPLAKAG